jgi:hypothetical protein
MYIVREGGGLVAEPVCLAMQVGVVRRAGD